MSRPEIRRTADEEFRHTYGIAPMSYPHALRKPVPIAEDDVSELWYRVKKYIEYMGFDDGSEFLRLLHEAEDVIREAEAFVGAFEPDESYDEYIAAHEADYQWED